MAGLLALAVAAPWGGFEPGPTVGPDSGLCNVFAEFELTAGANAFDGGCGAVGGGDAACTMQNGGSVVWV